VIRSLNEPRGEDLTARGAGDASIWGTTGTSIGGGGGGAGGGGLKGDDPGGIIIWAQATSPTPIAGSIAPTKRTIINLRVMTDMSGSSAATAS
jgi:hypothetical protein